MWEGLLLALVCVVVAQTGPCGADEPLCLGVGHPVKWQLEAPQQIRFRQGMDPLPQEPGSYTKGMIGWRVTVSIVSGHAQICCWWPYGPGAPVYQGYHVCAQNSSTTVDFDMSLSQTFTQSIIPCYHQSFNDKNLTYFQMSKTPIFAGPDDSYSLSYALDTRSTQQVSQVGKNSLFVAASSIATNYSYFLWNPNTELPKFEKVWEGSLDNLQAQQLQLVGDLIFYAEGEKNKINNTVLRWWWFDPTSNRMIEQNNTAGCRVFGSAAPAVQTMPYTDSSFTVTFVNAPKWGITCYDMCFDRYPSCTVALTKDGRFRRAFAISSPVNTLSRSFKPTQSLNIFDGGILHWNTFVQWPDYPSSSESDTYYLTNIRDNSLQVVSQDSKRPIGPSSIMWEGLPPLGKEPAGYVMYQVISGVSSFFEVVNGRRTNITTVPQNDLPNSDHYFAYTPKGLTWKVVYQTPNHKTSVWRILSYSRVAPGNWQPYEDLNFPSLAQTLYRWSIMQEEDVLCWDRSFWFTRINK